MEKDIFKQRRQMLADMILNNELYVPMKAKEIAMLLDIPKAKRSELMEVLDSLVADGTIGDANPDQQEKIQCFRCLMVSENHSGNCERTHKSE